MNEERQHAYFQLIEALLACPSGEELEILQVYPDLLDDSLVTTMETAIERFLSTVVTPADPKANRSSFLLFP
jgi:hypothetical protein